MQSLNIRGLRSIPQQSKGHYADIVIVGNGIAGLTAALEARRLAPEKRVVIVSDQSHPTINTPSLKHFAIGKLEREQLLTYPLGTERTKGVQLLHGRVEQIEARLKEVRLADGSTLGYGSLLIATGSRPHDLAPSIPGRDFDGVLQLHRLQDYVDLRRRLNEVSAAVVIGSGAHAIETVTALLHLGISTHWLLRGSTCLSDTLDETASAHLLQRIASAGATIHEETEAIGIAGHIGAVAGVVTNFQRVIPCQLVLICTGSTPVTTLAEHCSLPIMYNRNRGILVNNSLRTNVPDIYAAGDVAAVHNPLTGIHEVRAQWYAAVVQGCTAAKAMTGQSLPELPSFGVPWHATRLGDLFLLTAGSPMAQLPGSITLTRSRKGTYFRLTMINDRLIGYLSLGTASVDGLAIKRLIDEGHSIRKVKDSLLKGTFDARRFFTEQHLTRVFDPTTSGAIPVVSITPAALPAVRPFAAAEAAVYPTSASQVQFHRPLPFDRKDSVPA